MADTLDPSKYHIMSTEGKRNTIFVLILVFVLIIPLISFVYYKAAVRRPSQTDKEVTYEIKKGSGIFEISEGLYEKDAINSKFLFLFYVFVNGMDKNIQAGVYTIKAGSTVVDVAAQLLHGTNDVRVTFLEGWRTEEFAREAEKKLDDIDYNKFIAAAQPFEGYLFPDTYFLEIDITVEELVQLLKDTFTQKTSEILTEQNLAKIGLTKEQAVTMASIVEHEAADEEDKKIVAGILIRRFKEGMKLDADATVQYIVAFESSCGAVDYCTVDSPIQDERNIDWWPNRLTSLDLESDSPYNTRKVVGLPPTPISSVSLASLKSVVNPKITDYYYYLHDSEGKTYFARTLEEHNLNIQKYLTK